MKKRSVSTVCAVVLLLVAKAQLFIPHDPLEEPFGSSWTYLFNRGQAADITGALRPEIANHSIMGPVGVWVYEGGKVGITLTNETNDSIAEIDFSILSEVNQASLPVDAAHVDCHYNFYLEHCPQGVTGVDGSKHLVFEDVAPYIDLHVLSNQYGPKWYIVMRPGGDPADIMLLFEGHDELHIDPMGFLKAWIGNRYLVLNEGFAFQQDGNTINYVPWTPEYEHTPGSDIVTFEFGAYDPSLPLVIVITPFSGAGGMGGGGNPLPEWCSFMNGTANDFMADLTHDDEGYVYFTGTSSSALGLPGTGGLFSYAGSGDMILGRFNEHYEIEVPGTWFTYYGNGDTNDSRSIAYDPVFDRVGVCGATESMPGVPLLGNPNSFQGSGTGSVGLFNALNGQVQYFTRIQNNLVSCAAIDFDKDGNFFVTGTGIGPDDIPDLAGATDYWTGVGPENGPLFHTGFINKFDPQCNLLWGTTFGGPEDEVVYDLHIDRPNDKVYVVGSTISPRTGAQNCTPQVFQFPLCNAGGYFQNGLNGDGNFGLGHSDGFIARFNAVTLALEWSTYFGGQGEWEFITSVTTNDLGEVFVAGITNTGGCNFVTCQGSPTEHYFPCCDNGGYFEGQPSMGFYENFIAKFSAGTQLLWSTKVGGPQEEDALITFGVVGPLPERARPRVTCDGQDNVLLFGNTASGWTFGTDQPILPWNQPTGIYFEEHHNDGDQATTDAYVAKFSSAGALLGASYFGGQGIDLCGGITANDTRVYIAGSSRSTQAFPVSCPNLPGYQPYCDLVPLGATAYDGYIAQIRYDLVDAVTGPTATQHAGLWCYPNPASSMVNVGLDGGVLEGNVVVYDELGRTVASEHAQHRASVQIDIAGWPSGTYTVVADSPEGPLHVRFTTVR
ncbi:MAG: T9SS type A sorting domain-containing protein [Flavobacteriales bacterium]|nr:MAG: T9SS type A sorting domain-containing protein [Flavobacteriales bacterium]